MTRWHRVAIPDLTIAPVYNDLATTRVAYDLPCSCDRLGLGVRMGASASRAGLDHIPSALFRFLDVSLVS